MKIIIAVLFDCYINIYIWIERKTQFVEKFHFVYRTNPVDVLVQRS